MLLIYKFWLAVNFISTVLIFSCISEGIVNINGPSSAEGYVGHDIILMWNTTNGIPIKSAIFGLSNEGMADPQFINVNIRTGKVHYNPEISKTYAGRVDFVGNLTAGQAWFIIKKLQVNDTNEYLARITIDVNTVKSYTVTLRVRQPNEFQDKHLTSTMCSITKSGWKSLNKTVGKGPIETTSSGPEQKGKIDINFILAPLFILVVIILIILLVTYYYRKKRNKSMQEKQRQGNSKKGCSIPQAKENKEEELEALQRKQDQYQKLLSGSNNIIDM